MHKNGRPRKAAFRLYGRKAASSSTGVPTVTLRVGCLRGALQVLPASSETQAGVGFGWLEDFVAADTAYNGDSCHTLHTRWRADSSAVGAVVPSAWSAHRHALQRDGGRA